MHLTNGNHPISVRDSREVNFERSKEELKILKMINKIY
jgi:hypothetical protein